MNNKYFYISFVLLFINSYFAFSQSNEYLSDSITSTDSTYIITYEKLKKLYLKQLDSKSNKKMRTLYRAFKHKMNFEGVNSEIVPSPLPWIRKNIDRTTFLSIEEAEREWEAYKIAEQEDWKENIEYYKLQNEALRKFPQIIGNLIVDVRNNYHEKFAFWLYEKK